MLAVPDLALIAAIFLPAGGVKGVIGLGLPSVSLGLLTGVSMTFALLCNLTLLLLLLQRLRPLPAVA